MRQKMIYSYNECVNNETYYKIPYAKWKIEKCNNKLIHKCKDIFWRFL